MKNPVLKIKKANNRISFPSYQTEGSSGMDLRAFLEEPLTVAPMGRVMVPTGLRVEIPEGYEGQVRPRSGLAIKHGLTVLNSPGTIDSDYRGDLNIILVNLGSENVIIKDGDRIAQLVIAPVVRVEITEADTLDDTQRGSGGFGSTGIN